MNEITSTIAELQKIIQIEVEKECQRKVNIVKISKKNLIDSLTEIIKEIQKKHIESKKFWNKTVEIYQKFVAENPGSQLMKPPTSPPKYPSSFETIKGYIKLFNAFSEELITVELSFLKEIFNVSSNTIAEVNEIRTSYASMATGSMILYNSLNR